MNEIGTRYGGQLDKLPKISGTRGEGNDFTVQGEGNDVTFQNQDIEISRVHPGSGVCGKIGNLCMWVVVDGTP